MTGSDPSSAAIDISADSSAANCHHQEPGGSRIKIPSQDFNKHPTCPPEKGVEACESGQGGKGGKQPYPYTFDTVTQLIRHIDIQSLPLITNEVAFQLLKVQSSKFCYFLPSAWKAKVYFIFFSSWGLFTFGSWKPL